MASDILHQNSDEGVPQIAKESEDEEYPPLKVLLPALAAAYLVVFLVALVSIQLVLEDGN